MPHESLSKHAPNLAEWCIERMANRLDACGGYYRKGDKTTPTTRKQVDMSALLIKHFRATKVDHVVGLHSTCPESNTSKWLAFDIDAHDDKADTHANWKATLAIRARLEANNLTPHVFDSNGKGGYHIFVFFDDAYPTHRIHAFAQQVIKGLEIGVETFPKQPSIAPDTFGNWIRVPGRHHSNPHWSKVWTGEGWIELTADYLLSIEADTPNLPDAETTLRVARPDDDDGYEAPASEIAIVIHKLKQEAPAVEGKNGHNHTFAIACMVTRDHGLTVDQAMVAMSDWNSRCVPPWPRDELAEIVGNAQKYGTNLKGSEPAERNFGQWGIAPEQADGTAIRVPRAIDAEKPYISNAVSLKGEDGKPYYQCIPLDKVANEIVGNLGGWPKVVANGLFVEQFDGSDDLMPSYRYFKDHNQFFAWLKLNADVHWLSHQSVKGAKARGNNVSLVKDKEIFEHFNQTLPPYAAIGGLPHTPKIDGLYYPDISLPAPTGDALGELVDSFNAETPEDRTLMLAAFMTPLWGGEPGSRPAFVFTSDHGRGVGKTTTVEVFAELYGGAISLSGKERGEDFKQRLLGDTALSQRVCIKDNVKGRLDDAALEGLITSRWIDGHRMYFGQTRRPNLMTWYVTANTPALSRDIADRSYIIRVGSQKHQKDWRTWAFKFIRENRAALLADILVTLQGPSQSTVTRFDRWKAWQVGVLAKLPGADEIIEINEQRRKDCDDDTAQANDLEETMAEEIARRGHDEYDRVLISSDQLYSILKDYGIVNKNYSKASAMRWVARVVADVGTDSRLVKNGHNGSGRSWFWFGSQTDGETVLTPLKSGTDRTDSGRHWDG